MKFSLVDFLPKEASRCLPDVDENGISDFVVIFTNKGDRDIAQYNANKKLWYSATDPTGFANVWKWSNYIEPEDFVEDPELYRFFEGEV